jgi:uncharacterized protein
VLPLVLNRFPVAELLSGVTVPTVVVYGTADEVVPAAQSRAVAEQAGGPVSAVVIDGARHNDAALVHGPAVISAVRDLADRIP